MSRPDDPICVVEDLDPEPEQPPGRFQLRELVLGLVLLVGVLVFAGWQWWSQEARQSSYGRAADALAEHDLDQARALFAGASGYRDADTRVAELDRRIALRDSLYISATTQISAGNWAPALAYLRDLHDIQPGFRDTPALEFTAVTHLARRTLDSSVALRDPPDGSSGLYYRHNSNWVYLPGSDLKSRIQGSGAQGILVYDVPIGAPNDEARKIMLANFLGPEPTSTLLNPTAYQSFDWNEAGVWAFRAGRYSTPGRPPVANALHGVEAEYLPFGGGDTHSISFGNTGGAEGEVLVDVDGSSDRYLTATWTGAQQWSSGILSNTIISLFLGSAGGEKRLLYSTRGNGIDSARLSRDGRFVLVTTFTPSANGSEVYRLYLLDLQNGGEAQQIDGVRARPYNGEGPTLQWIASTFIQSGAYAGKVLAAVFNYDHTHLRLYDPELAEDPLLDVEVPTSEGLMWAVSRADERGLVVSGALSHYSPPYGRDAKQTMPVVEISARGQVTRTGVLVDKHSYPYLVDLAPDHLAIVSVVGDGGRNSWTVYSAPASTLGQSAVQPTVLYTRTVIGAVGLADIAPLSIGDGLLNYVEDDTLYVRTYDGVVDVPLEEGISALYSRRYLHDRYPVLR